MSLNSFTSSAIKKEWMNISCNDIKSDSLQVSGKDVVTTGGNKNLDITLTTTQTVFTNDQELITKKYVDDSGGGVPPNVLTTSGGQNITLTNTTSQTVFTNDQELITKKYVDDSGVPPNVLTTSGGQNITLTNTTSQTVFTNDQELITKKYVDTQKPVYTNFLKNFSGEFFNDGIIVLEWDGFDEILMRLVTTKNNVYASSLVNNGGSFPSGSHMILSTVNNDFYQNSSIGQVEYTISCDDDNSFPFYKCRFLVSGNNSAYYCYSIIEKFV